MERGEDDRGRVGLLTPVDHTTCACYLHLKAIVPLTVSSQSNAQGLVRS